LPSAIAERAPAGATEPSPRARARRTLDVLAVLARSDLQLRYGRGSFRILKWLLDPLAALGVYLLLVAFVLDESGEAIGLSIACAIVPFQLVTTTMTNALQSINLRGTIIVNMSFPRMLIPASSLVTESIAFPATFVILPVMMVAYGIEPTAAILWLPVTLLVTAAFSLALAYPSALLGVWYPELQPFAVSLIRTMFFLAPGLVALDAIAGMTRELLPINPLTGLFESFRDALLYGHAPAAWELLVPLGAAVLILAAVLPIYRREQPELAKLVG
jgi:ABC-type polysaccharide/polyol phosphate export permease